MGPPESTPLVAVIATMQSVVTGQAPVNNSGAEDYLWRKTSEKQKIIHTITETDRIPYCSGTALTMKCLPIVVTSTVPETVITLPAKSLLNVVLATSLA